ncbi:MAG: hypothetical protein GY778_08550 [bacterium]|nr:hypothetical protein [bacterium]
MSDDQKTGSALKPAPPPAQSDRPTDSAPSPSDRRAPYRPKYKPLWNNFITLTGFYVVITAFLGLLTFGLFSTVAPVENPYVDIVGYMIIPGILLIGVVIVPFGILIKSWRIRRRNPEERLAFRFPRIDLNDPSQRKVAKIMLAGTFVLLPVVGVSSYHGYHYTDSVQFCAQVCHEAMEPQGVAYERSGHARVPCADCHIGEGAGWFVKSKLSGTRQVLAMFQDSFSRPIPPAIHHLRPARETCEHCHWPKKFFGAQLREMARFASDEQNTRRDISMLLKTGGGDVTSGRAMGIHKHMAMAGRVEYVAIDDTLQNVPWVKYTLDDGQELIYRSDGRPSSDPRPEGQLRSLDCMDCHNRPAHRFKSPDEEVDTCLEIGATKIDPALPFIKRETVAALVRHYPDAKTADDQIKLALTKFYRENYPEVWEAKSDAVHRAVDSVREIYHMNFFPAMNVDWKTYPDNIGHKISSGCFRCHEGRHINQFGDPISHDCEVCHTFLNPVARNGAAAVIHEGEFQHPMPLEGQHAGLRCSQCHDGGPALLPTCEGCHSETTGLRTAEAVELRKFDIQESPMLDVDCDSCHDLSEPRSLVAIDAACTECHDPEDDERFDGMLGRWNATAHSAAKKAASAVEKLAEMIEQGPAGADQGRAGTWLDQHRPVLDFLERAGPLHNYEASIKIYDEIARQAEAFLHEDDLADSKP